jgi:hypothetical protein
MIPSDGAMYFAHSRALLTDAQNAEIDVEVDRLIELVVTRQAAELRIVNALRWRAADYSDH